MCPCVTHLLENCIFNVWVPHSPDYFYFYSLAMCFSQAHCGAWCSTLFSWPLCSCLCEVWTLYGFYGIALPLGIRRLRFPSTTVSTTDGKSNNSRLRRSERTTSLISDFLIVSELSAALRIYHRTLKASPPVATLGKATGCWGPGWGTQLAVWCRRNE